jgi:hypothetical protein
MKTLIRTRTTALGDVIVTRVTVNAGRFIHEDIEITGPPELIEITRSGTTGGRDWYRREAPSEKRR